MMICFVHIETDAMVYVAICCMNTVALSLSFGFSLCAKLKRQSAVSVAIESSNQNTALAIAIILLSLDDGYERDLALNVPVLYMLLNGVFVVVFGVTLRRTGWLQIDESDKTMTFGKIINECKQNRKNRERARQNSADPSEKMELSEDLEQKKNKTNLERQAVSA